MLGLVVVGAPLLRAQNVGVTAKIGSFATGHYVSLSVSAPCLPSTDSPSGICGGSVTAITSAAYWNGTAQFSADKDYYVSFTTSIASGAPSYGGGGGYIAVAAPPGYRVQINQQFTTTYSWTCSYANGVMTYGAFGAFTLRIVSPQSSTGGRAGVASSITSGQVRWQVAMGSLKNGTTAGSMVIADAGTQASWSGIFTPAALQYLSPSAEIVCNKDGAGQLRQILTNQAYIDIVTKSSTSYQIDFYPPSSLGAQVYAPSTPYVFSGTPYVSYLIKQGGTATTLQIQSTTRNLANGTVARYAVTTLTRTGTAVNNYTWVLDDWNDCDVNGNVTAGQQVREEKRVWGGTASNPTETITVYTPGNAADLTVNNMCQVFNWGQQVVSTTSGSTNPTPASTSNFVTTGTTASPSYALPVSTVSAEGDWSGFDYYGGTDNRWFWAVNHHYRPFNNQAMPATFSTSQGEVTTFQYALDAFGAPTRPISIVTQINGVTTSQSVISYANANAPAPDGQAVIVSTKTDSTNATNTVTSTTSYYSEFVPDDFFTNQHRSVVQPDGVQTSYAYQRGTFNAGLTGQAAFTASTTGTGSSIAEITGSSIAANGTAYSTYNGFPLDPIYLVSGKSTMTVTLRDSLAMMRQVQSYAWVGGAWQLVGYTLYTYDASGQL